MFLHSLEAGGSASGTIDDWSHVEHRATVFAWIELTTLLRRICIEFGNASQLTQVCAQANVGQSCDDACLRRQLKASESPQQIFEIVHAIVRDYGEDRTKPKLLLLIDGIDVCICFETARLRDK